MRDNDVKKINYFVRILPRDSLYIIEAVELITRKSAMLSKNKSIISGDETVKYF